MDPQQSYTVQPGDTLWDIAEANGIPLHQLEALNPQISNPNLIHPGEVVNLAGSGAAGSDGSASSSAGTSSGSYTVQPGDTLWDIAEANGIPLHQLEALNPQISNPNLIHPGEVVNLAGSGAAGSDGSASSSAGTSSGSYTVQPGDTLWDIAEANGIPLHQLEALNPQISNPNLIHPGEVVNLAGSSAASDTGNPDSSVPATVPSAAASGDQPSGGATSDSSVPASPPGSAASDGQSTGGTGTSDNGSTTPTTTGDTGGGYMFAALEPGASAQAVAARNNLISGGPDAYTPYINAGVTPSETIPVSDLSSALSPATLEGLGFQLMNDPSGNQVWVGPIADVNSAWTFVSPSGGTGTSDNGSTTPTTTGDTGGGYMFAALEPGASAQAVAARNNLISGGPDAYTPYINAGVTPSETIPVSDLSSALSPATLEGLGFQLMNDPSGNQVWVGPIADVNSAWTFVSPSGGASGNQVTTSGAHSGTDNIAMLPTHSSYPGSSKNTAKTGEALNGGSTLNADKSSDPSIVAFGSSSKKVDTNPLRIKPNSSGSGTA